MSMSKDYVQDYYFDGFRDHLKRPQVLMPSNPQI